MEVHSRNRICYNQSLTTILTNKGHLKIPVFALYAIDRNSNNFGLTLTKSEGLQVLCILVWYDDNRNLLTYCAS